MTAALSGLLPRYVQLHFFEFSPYYKPELHDACMWGPIIAGRLHRAAMMGEQLTDKTRAMILDGLPPDDAAEYVARTIFAVHLFSFRPLLVEDRAMIERMKGHARELIPLHIRKLICIRPLHIPSLKEIADSIDGRLTLPEMMERLGEAFA